MPEAEDPRRADRVALLSATVGALATILGFLASLLSIALAIGAYTDIDLDAVLLVTQKVHWIIWISIFSAIYVLISYLVTKIEIKRKTLSSVFRIPLWTELRAFGDQRVARISYLALILIPILSYVIHNNIINIFFLNEFRIPLNMKLSFFVSWFFSFALLLFAVGCPKEFRKSNPLEQAKTINLLINESQAPRVLIEGQQNDVDDPVADRMLVELRAFCYLFYVLGVIFSIVILFRTAVFMAYV